MHTRTQIETDYYCVVADRYIIVYEAYYHRALRVWYFGNSGILADLFVDGQSFAELDDLIGYADKKIMEFAQDITRHYG